MNIKNVQSNQQVSLTQNNAKVLKEGSSVLVRIIASKGNGKYEASVSGVKVEVSAKNPLKTGQTFVATVNSRNGMIEINPQDSIKSSLFNTVFLENNSGELLSIIENPQIQALLTSLGMVPDNLSFSILNQLKQLGMKIDSSLMNKIYNLSIKFKGKEKKAAELMLLLKQKGIDFSEEEIQQLLIQLENNDSSNFENNRNFIKSDTNFEINGFFNSFLKEISDSKNEVGILTIMNHLGWKKDKSGNGSWIILPYEIADKNDSEILGNGCLKLYLDNLKKMKRLHINCIYQKKTYNINLTDNPLEIDIKINVQGINETKEKIIENLKNSIKTDKKINIEFVEKEIAEGFGAGLEKMIMAGGLI